MPTHILAKQPNVKNAESHNAYIGLLLRLDALTLLTVTSDLTTTKQSFSHYVTMRKGRD